MESKNEPIQLRLKLPESEKFKNNGQWFKDYAKYIVPSFAFVVEDFAQMKKSYDIVNNNIDGFKADLKKMCSPISELQDLEIEEEILPYNQISNYINILKGETLQRKDAHKIALLNSESIRKKNEAYKDYIMTNKIEPELALMIESSKMQMEGMKPEEIQQYVEQMKQSILPDDFNIKDFKVDSENLYAKILKYCYVHEDVKDKKLETIQDLITVGKLYLYSGWENGKPIIKVINPMFCGFHKRPDEKYVQKADYVYYRTTITIPDLIAKYGDKLTPEELTSLGISHTSFSPRDKRFDVAGGTATFVRDQWHEDFYRELNPGQNNSAKTVGMHQGTSGTIRDRFSNLIWESHIEFKAFREVIFLTSPDEYGKPHTTVVSSEFEIPDDAIKINYTNDFGDKCNRYEWVDPILKIPYTAEILWIPRRYEMTRLGSDIIVDYREVPFQPLNIQDPYSSFELSYKGLIIDSRNTTPISPVERATPFIFQSFIIKHLINKELAKYTGYVQDVDTDQIPEGLGNDHNGEKIRDHIAAWFAYRKQEGINFYSGSQTSFGNLPPSTRSPGSKGYLLGTAAEILNLQKLYDVVNIEIGMALGISPQRMAGSTPQLTATDNQQNLQQSYSITEFYFDQHNEVWKYALKEYINNFKHYIQLKLKNGEDCFLHYILPDGTEELLNFTPDSLDTFEDVGLYISNSGNDKIYRDMMLQMSHAIAQNAGQGSGAISALIKKITEGESAEDIHKSILLLEEKLAKQQQSMQKMKDEAQAKLTQMQIDAREDEQLHEVNIETLKGEYGIKKELIRSYINQEDQDKDKDGLPDQYEIYKLEQGDRKLDLDAKKLELAALKIQEDSKNKAADRTIKRSGKK